ncbi:hypothetical protein [Paracoccus saliphilus]|uniref:Uncharacterized protein n=1 Tax=Paracoccus saliphilus TaxID=405559 RepID=A0AA46A5S7_9RHOB|nr:hypothetical protein [Paracoccus saliphilus]WCR04550.1 hypothetical protein JHX88_07475 [Paracoccus saliphilus]SIS86651.1 hypothetical protein SAMN05421772_1074 [Paracoccus saliphilus]
MHIDRPSPVGGHVDTRTGVLYRKPGKKVETHKRQRPARLPSRYPAQLRWQAGNGRIYIVERRIERDGKLRRETVKDDKNAWVSAWSEVEILARLHGVNIDLSGVTPRTLKHIAITWALQRGATIWDAAGYFSISAETIERTYGHHSSNHQATAVKAMDMRG